MISLSNGTPLPLAALAATLTVVTPCSAQARIEITPFVGAYLPGNDLGSKIATNILIDVRYTSGASYGQQDAPIGGAQLVVWLGNRIAVELGAGYSPSGTINRTWACLSGEAAGLGSGSCPAVSDGSGQVVMGTARLLVSVNAPRMHRPSPYLVLGGGVVDHSGPGIDGAEQTLGMAIQRTYWGPIVGMGIRLPFTPTNAARLEFVGMQPGSEPHGDYALSAGLSMCLWKCGVSTGLGTNP